MIKKIKEREMKNGSAINLTPKHWTLIKMPKQRSGNKELKSRVLPQTTSNL